jgi:ribosome modulation factor
MTDDYAKQGAEAYALGRRRRDCPYQGTRRIKWQEGWDKANQKIELKRQKKLAEEIWNAPFRSLKDAAE